MNSQNPYDPPRAASVDQSQLPLGFSLRVLAFSTLALVVAYGWLLTRIGDRVFYKIPALYLADVSMMGLGLMGILFVCLPVWLASALVVAVSRERPATSILFLGIQTSVFFVDISSWGTGMRFWCCVLLGAVAMNVEIYLRKLPLRHRILGVAAIVVSAAWYSGVLAASAAAAV